MRNLNPEADLPNLLQLRIVIESIDQLGMDTSEEYLRDQFNWPNHDPARDRWVIEQTNTGHFVGYGWIFAQSPSRAIIEVAIHPSWRRQGLGTQLLTILISAARNLKSTQIVSGAKGSSRTARPFLEANHFRAVGTNRFLVAPSHTKVSKPSWPDGFSIQSYKESSNLSWLVEGSNRCYGDMWGHRENSEPATVAHLKKRMLQFPAHYVPEGMFVALDSKQNVAGICFNRVERAGHKRVIDSPGVVPEYRHLGLQRPIVQASMQWLQAHGEGKYHLDTWGDSAGAVEIYQDLGFRLDPNNLITEYLLETT